MTQIILKQYNKPAKDSVEKDVEWFCDSFGLSSGRDIEDTSNRIVNDILVTAADNRRISSESISDHLALSQNLINHHLRNLINSGLVVRERKQIMIRGGSLKEAVTEIRKDALRILDSIEVMAGEIDEELGLKNRQ